MYCHHSRLSFWQKNKAPSKKADAWKEKKPQEKRTENEKQEQEFGKAEANLEKGPSDGEEGRDKGEGDVGKSESEPDIRAKAEVAGLAEEVEAEGENTGETEAVGRGNKEGKEDSIVQDFQRLEVADLVASAER